MISKQIPYLQVRVKGITCNTFGYRKQNIQVQWLIQIGINFSPPLPSSETSLQLQNSGISSPIILGLICLLAIPSLVLLLYKVAAKDPTMIINRRGSYTLLISGSRNFSTGCQQSSTYSPLIKIYFGHPTLQRRLKNKVLCFSFSHSVVKQRNPCRK